MGLPVRSVYISRVRDPLAAIPEIVKYCFKPYVPDGVSGVSELEFYELIYTALHGRRCIQTYGEIRKTVRELRLDLEGEEDTPAPSADEPGIMLLRYNRKRGKYEPGN